MSNGELYRLGSKQTILRWLRWEFAYTASIACFALDANAHHLVVYKPFDSIRLPVDRVLVKCRVNGAAVDLVSAAIDIVFLGLAPKVVAPVCSGNELDATRLVYMAFTYCTWSLSPPRNSKSISSPPSAIMMNAVTAPPVPAERMVADTLPYRM